MDHQDRQAIEGLFNRLNDVERAGGERDGEAEAFIRERLLQQPGAPYYMAQTIVMQDYALNSAQEELQELRRQLSERPAENGGFLSRIMGGSAQPARSAGRVPNVGRGGGISGGGGGVWGNTPQGLPMQAARPGRGGGGFLAGAAQTAMGVAGGVLLGSAIAGMFDGNEADAAETGAADAAATDPAPEEAAAVDDGGFDSGFDGMDL